MLMRMGGVAGGVKNAESSGNTRFKVVKPGQFRCAFWSESCEFGRSLSSFSSNPCSKAVQNDHIGPAKGVEALQQFRRFSLAPDRDQGYVARHSGSDLTLVERARRDAMRWGYLLAMGVAGVLSGSVLAQLPSNPASATRTLPPGYSALPTAGTPQHFASLPPVNVEIKTAIPANHEWLLKPEHGAYFISVKSFARPPRPTPEDQGPSALAMAEALAGEIRDLYRVQAFLYEHVSDERKAEMAAIAAARARSQQYVAQWDKLREQAQLKGMEFLEPDRKIRYRTVKYKDQIAVLVGGFKSDEDARKALDTVRKWPAPKSKVKDHNGRDVLLMDMGTIFRPGPNGKQLLQESPINPFPTATVVPNPTIVRPKETWASGVDPVILKLNEGRPYNLLKASKNWTLGVKSFCAGRDRQQGRHQQRDAQVWRKQGGRCTDGRRGASRIAGQGPEGNEEERTAARDRGLRAPHA